MSFLKIGLGVAAVAAVGYVGYKVYDRSRTIPMTPELEAEIAADEAYDAEHGDGAAMAARLQRMHDTYQRAFGARPKVEEPATPAAS